MITLTNFATRWKKEFKKNPSKFPELQRELDIYKNRLDNATNDIERGQEKSSLLKRGLEKREYKNAFKVSVDKDGYTNITAKPGFNKNQIVNQNRLDRIDQLKKNIKNKALKKEQISKLKKAVLNKKTLGIAGGTLAVGAGLLAANKLRKARSDRGKKRGSYK